MQLVTKLIASWPKLAWVATHTKDTDQFTVYHGRCVETHDQWCVEAVWAGDFGSGNFDQTDLVFGSGIRLRGDRVIIVSSGTTVDRICFMQNSESLFISNSLPALLAVTGTSLRTDYSGYTQDSNSIVFGLNKYKRHIPTTGDDVQFLYFNNLVIHNGQMTEEEKPDVVAPFKTFEDYYTFLINTAKLLISNLNDQGRNYKITPVTTVSSGYDAAATAVIASSAGCKSAMTFKQSSSFWRGSDSGKHIADKLGMECKEYDRTAKNYPLEETIWATTGQPRVLSWTLFDYPEPLSLLFTGCYGDLTWDSNLQRELPPLAGASLANGGIGEFRLFQGIFHCPVPYWANRHRLELLDISLSPQMKPWVIGNNYDRPIARRILEEAGIPRGTFAARKKNTSHDAPFLWPYSHDAQKKFQTYLRTQDIKSPGNSIIGLFRHFANLENLFYRNVSRKVGLADFKLRQRMAPEGTSLLYHWANEELKKLYNDKSIEKPKV